MCYVNKQRVGSLYEFRDVDRSTNPISYIDYLDRSNANQNMRTAKEHIASFLRPKNGHVLLDIGCGVGHDAKVLASFVGKTGLVVGIDKSKVMIQEAKRRFRRTALPIEFYPCDAHKLDFPANKFNGSVCFSVLTHCEQPAAVISEAHRVLRPRGRLVAFEPDWDSLVISTGEQSSDELLTSILKKSVYHGGIAHQLPNLFTQCRFQFVTVQTIALTISDYELANKAWRIEPNIAHAQKTRLISAADADHLRCGLRNLTQQFFGALMVFAVTGTKGVHRSRTKAGAEGAIVQTISRKPINQKRRTHGTKKNFKENYRSDPNR